MASKEGRGAPTHVEISPNVEPAGSPPIADSGTQIDQGDGKILLDAKAGDGHANVNLKLAEDGHTILVPQPSNDPNDPLNWSWWKKHSILAVICVSGFIADFQASAAVPCLLPQAVQWHLTPTQVNYANNLNVLFIAIGGVFWIPVLFSWGRAPSLFYVVLVSTCFALGCTLAPNFEVYYAFRALEGFTATAGQTAGLAFLQDMFFFHEQARKIGVWTAVFLGAPYLGPLFGNFMVVGTGSWRPVFWLVFAMGCFNLALIATFLDETWYRRDLEQEKQPARGNRIWRVIGLWQIRVHHDYFGTISKSCRRLSSVLLKPVMLPVMAYYLLNIMWAVGINQTSAILFATPIAVGGYGLTQATISYFYFAPIIAVVLGEIFGHYFNDFVARRYVRRHSGVFVPEARLKTVYVSAILVFPGLIIVGQALQHHLHWIVLLIGWSLYVLGYMIGSVSVTAYLLDCYPTASGEISALLGLARNLGGFCVGYFQLAWGIRDGYDVSFGVQAAIVAASTLIIPACHFFGERLRHRAGPLRF